MVASSNPVDVGWCAVRTRRPALLGVMGNFRLGIRRLGRKVMVKVYGVAMMMPQG